MAGAGQMGSGLAAQIGRIPGMSLVACADIDIKRAENALSLAEISNDLFDAAYAGLGQFRGGLALSTVVACAGFSAVCGSSLATAATMTKVSMPAMKRYKYSDSLASGTIASGGTLGIMIPPSVPLVIYGIVSEQDIGLLYGNRISWFPCNCWNNFFSSMFMAWKTRSL